MGVLTDGIHQPHHLNSSRAQGIGDVLARIMGPADDIDLLAAQFIHNLLNPGSAGTDAGPDRIHFAFDAVHSHLGAGTDRAGRRVGFPGDGHDAHGPFLNLRNLVFKQVNHQAGIGAADEQLGAASGHFAHFLEEHLEGGVGAVVVVRELIAAWKFCLHLRASQP